MDFGLAKSSFLCHSDQFDRRYGAFTELGSNFANRSFYVFLYYELHRDQGRSLSTVKNISKAVVPVLFLILCRFVVYTRGRLTF